MSRKILVADLLCGAGGSSTGCARALAALGLKMELVCVNHWGVALETHKKNHPEARHYCQDISAVRPHIVVPEGYLDLLMASPTCTHHSVARGGKPTSDQQRSDPWHIITWLTELRVKRMVIENVWEFCFPPETAVLSKRGMVPIGELKVGDEVWTHNARWKPVTAVSRRRSSTVRVTGYGNSIIETTPNHEFYARQIAPKITKSGKFGRHQIRLLEPEWVRADRLANSDESSAYTQQYSGLCWATPRELPRYWRRMPKTLGVDTDAPAFFYMIGRWLGDGWVKQRKNGRQSLVRICEEHTKADELERRLAETGLRWKRYRHTKSVDVFDLATAPSRILIRWLRANFGEYAHGKRLPAWIFGASQEQRWALIEGYHDADGNARLDGVTNAVTVSRCLAIGVRLLLQSLGRNASVHRTPARQLPAIGREGAMMNCRETYHVTWRRETEWDKGREGELHTWGPVRKVEPCRDDVEVVDIAVADDHSFIADGQVVHNCGWGPVDPRTGKPIKARKGEFFRLWIDTIRGLGYDPEWRKLNAADFGDATTRQRFILMARNDRRSISWPIPTHRKRPEGELALFPGIQSWRPAREIIDWNLKGRSIFGRKKPLAPKTLARIYAGAVKFNWPEPFLVILRNHMAGQSVDGPLPTIAANGTHIGLAEPVLVNMKGRSTAMDVDAPVPTLTAGSGHVYVAEPVIVSPRHGKEGAGPQPRSVEQPLPTITAGGSQVAVAEPVIMNGRKNNKAKAVSTDPVPTLDTKGAVWLAEPFVMAPGSYGAPRETGEPLPTITTGGAGVEERPGCARPMLVEPLILNRNSAPRGETRPVSEPAPTPTTSGGGYLIQPFILSQASGGAPRSTDDPAPTIPTDGAHALISPYYGAGSGETCNSVQDPLPTVTSKGRFGVVVPVTNGSGGPNARSTDEPLATMTTAKGGEFAIVMPVTHHDKSDRVRDVSEPLSTVTGANRGELAFITAQHGERPGQAPRVHDIEQPAPTIAATGHVDLVEATEQYDILFRMLEPHELAAAMGFTGEEARYEFAGTKTEQIKQIGNAVSVAKMQACVSAIMADAVPKRKAAPADDVPIERRASA